jgi:NAD dependent epimerase/dehydratase
MSEVKTRVLVTGATGFIGSHLCEALLVRGHEVRAFAHYNSQGHMGNLEYIDQSLVSGLDVYFGDISDPESVQKAVEGCSVVFHLAALVAIPYSYLHPREFFVTNTLGTLNVCQAALQAECERIVHTSTSEVYGTARTVPITEDHPLHAQSPYAASKIGADKVVESFHLSYGLPTVTVRPFNTYGPRQSPRAVIPAIIGQLLETDTVRLGNLEPKRDLTFVSDTVDGFIKAAWSDKSVGEVFNLGTGKAYSIGELARILVDMVRPGAEIVSDPARVRPARSEVGVLVASAEKARSVLGWKPEVSLEDGLAKTVEYMREAAKRGYASRPTQYAI